MGATVVTLVRTEAMVTIHTLVITYRRRHPWQQQQEHLLWCTSHRQHHRCNSRYRRHRYSRHRSRTLLVRCLLDRRRGRRVRRPPRGPRPPRRHPGSGAAPSTPSSRLMPHPPHNPRRLMSSRGSVPDWFRHAFAINFHPHWFVHIATLTHPTLPVLQTVYSVMYGRICRRFVTELHIKCSSLQSQVTIPDKLELFLLNFINGEELHVLRMCWVLVACFSYVIVCYI